MKIKLDNIGKRFQKTFLYRHFSYEFTTEKIYGIKGGNGAGKSTLLQLIASYQLPTEGTVTYYTNENKSISSEEIYSSISCCAPYIELVEEYTIEEQIKFHFSIVSSIQNISVEAILAHIELDKNKKIEDCSSGMKQRVKCALAVYTNSTILLLDEPSTNLDEKAIQWWKALVQKYAKNRIIIIASNESHDFDFCTEIISL